MPAFKRVAKSLDKLLGQLNAAYPRRDKAADGGVGDLKHQTRKSDHNPNAAGIVQARDFDHDPKAGANDNAPGVDIANLCAVLVKHKDRRIKYIICNGKIISGWGGPSPWIPRDYNGTNAHKQHLHLSVVDDEDLYDDASAWNLEGLNDDDDAPPVVPSLSDTEWLREFQRKRGLLNDAIVGPKTLRALRLAVEAA
jgi:hypothetical protein